MRHKCKGDQPLSDRLHCIANEVSGSEIDDGRDARISYRQDLDESYTTDLPVGDSTHPYDGSVQQTIFL